MVALNATSNAYAAYRMPQSAPYPFARTASEPTSPATPAMSWDKFSKVSSMAGAGAGGALASYKLSEAMAESMFNYSELGELAGSKAMVFASFKEMGAIGVKGAGISALVSAGVSVVANGIGLAKGDIDRDKAVRNVVGDTITGAVGGLGAVTLGGLGGLALVKMGATGLPITMAVVAIGAVSGVAAAALKDKLMKA